MSKEGNKDIKSNKLAWLEECKRLQTLENNLSRGISSVYALIKDPSMKKEISELQVMERKCLSERTNEYNTLVNKLKSIRHKVSSLKQHTEKIEEGDQYIRILQKIIDSTQSDIFRFKKWARDRYDDLQNANISLTNDIDHFEELMSKWVKTSDDDDNNKNDVEPGYSKPTDNQNIRNIDLEARRKQLEEWKLLKIKRTEEEQRMLDNELHDKEEREMLLALKKKKELEKKKLEVSKWKAEKMKREEEERKKEELIKKREEELRLKEEKEKREREKAEVAMYKLQKQEEKQIINTINKIEEREKHIPPSPELLLYRHKLNLEKVNKRKDLINRKQRAESARKVRMDDLMNRPSSVEAPRDKNRVLQPTAAYQGKRYSSDELDMAEAKRAGYGAHEKVIPGMFAAEVASGRSKGFAFNPVPMRATPAWMKG